MNPDRKVIGSVFRSFDRSLRVGGIRRIPTGRYNTTFLVDTGRGPFILRIAPPDDAVFLFYEKNNMLAEPLLHRLVAENTSLRVPRIYLMDTSRRLLPRNYLIMEHLDAAPGLLTPGTRERVGAMLRELHAFSPGEHGYIWPNRPMPPRPDWPSAFRVMWAKLVADIVLVGHFSAAEASFARAVLESRQAAFLARRPAASLLHMDVWVENILLDRKKGEIYLVDWDRALSGDPEIELAVLDYCGLLGPDFWRGYGRRPPAGDDGFRIRSAFYHLYEVMKYIVIAQGRRHDRRRALEYRNYAFETLRRLGDGVGAR